MFNKPEEIIMAILGITWIIATYFLAGYATNASLKYMLIITLLTTLWSVISFFLWKTNHFSWLWPILLGALAACWWPWFDWFALRNIPNISGVYVLQKPWYASWTFKLLISSIFMILGYLFKWHRYRKQITANSL